MTIRDEIIDELLSGEDPQAVFAKDGLLEALKKALAERILDAELEHHLRGERAQAGRGTPHKGVRRRPSLLVAPRFGETMHAVMRAIVTAASQSSSNRRCVDRRSRRGSLASFSRIWARTSTHAPSFGAGCTPRSYLNAVLWLRTTLRTVARETRSVRTISLIGRRCSK